MNLTSYRHHKSLSRVRTTLQTSAYLQQYPMWWQNRDKQRWAVTATRIRVVANDPGDYNKRDVAIYSRIVREHHYLGRWPVKQGCKILAYLADLDGIRPGRAGAAGMAMFALQPSRCWLDSVLGLHQCSRLELVRCWRADDLNAEFAPFFFPHMLARIIKGNPAQGLPSLADVWTQRKLNNGLSAVPRVLVSYADPSVGHDGGLYRAAGFVDMGEIGSGKRMFVYALDKELKRKVAIIARVRTAIYDDTQKPFDHKPLWWQNSCQKG